MQVDLYNGHKTVVVCFVLSLDFICCILITDCENCVLLCVARHHVYISEYVNQLRYPYCRYNKKLM